jgi:hypothetical protein
MRHDLRKLALRRFHLGINRRGAKLLQRALERLEISCGSWPRVAAAF